MFAGRKTVPAELQEIDMSDVKKKNIRKVLFIVPPCTLPAGRINVATPPLGLMYLAAVMEKENCVVNILDSLVEGYYHSVKVNRRDVRYGLDYEEIKKRIAFFSPDLVGVSCQSSVQFANTMETCRAVREVCKDAVVVMGGPHSTVYPEKVLEGHPEIDFIVIGEGEYSFRDLVAALRGEGQDLGLIDGLAYRKDGRIKINPKKTLIENLDELPFPARHLVPMEKYFKINFNQNLSFVPKSVSIMTSRGCGLKCIFCFNKNFWLNRYRTRSPENVLAEIDQIYKEYGVRELQFSDDNLTFDRARAIKLFTMMKERKYSFKWSAPNGLFAGALDDDLLRLMKESGCYEVRIAIESGNESVLHDIIKKDIKLSHVEEVLKSARRHKLLTSAFLSIGYPGETPEQMEETFAYARRVRPGCVFLSIASPLPNTELMDLSVKRGMKVSTGDYSGFEFSNANADTD
ncbi:MAG: radical SAM protein, partial [Candidatus Omnitrophota bacterium]